MGLMTASGGLTKSKLRLATAMPRDVVVPATFYAGGSKELQAGSLVDRPNGISAVSVLMSGSDLYYRIPNGAYREVNQDHGNAEVRATGLSVMNQVLIPTSAGNYSDNGNTNSSTSLSHSFSLTAGRFYLFILDVGTRDGSSISASLSTPNCTNLLSLSYSDTQDKAYYDSRLIVSIVRCNSNTTATASVSANNIRSAGRIICYKLSNW